VKRPPPPKLAPPPPPYIPPPEVRIQSTAPAQNVITAVTNAKPVETPPPPPPPQVVHEPVRVLPVLDRASYREPEYPATSRRLEETGSVLLQLLVDVDGTVAESKVAQSSGFPRLDEAARTALSKCRFKPGTVDGKPERVWLPYKYTWRLN
jgi:periplasmic protein TonB